jgi:FkbM family methyltransferase
MKDSCLGAALFLSRRPYFKGRDRLTHYLLVKASRYGLHRIHIDGLAFDLNLEDSLSQSLYLRGQFPGSTWKAIDLLLEPGMIMVDAGANIGYTALVGARRVGPSGKVFAFEPSPRAFGSLKSNTLLNRMDWLQLECSACGEESGEMLLHISSHSDEYNSLARDTDLLDRTAACHVVRLDQYLSSRNVAHVDLIKIDVEGAEWHVLKGLHDLLMVTGRSRPILIVESCPKNTTRFGYMPAEMFERLAAAGYQLKILTVDGSILPFASDYVTSPEGLCDVICYDSSRQDRIETLTVKLAEYN